MSNQTKLRQSFRVGYRFRITMTLRENGFVHVEWDPYLPKRLSEAEKRDYFAARDQFLARALPDLLPGLLEVA